MCEYCEGKTKLIDGRIVLEIIGNELESEYDGLEEHGQAFVIINFCPMCGRNLKE